MNPDSNLFGLRGNKSECKIGIKKNHSVFFNWFHFVYKIDLGNWTEWIFNMFLVIVDLG